MISISYFLKKTKNKKVHTSRFMKAIMIPNVNVVHIVLSNQSDISTNSLIKVLMTLYPSILMK